MKKKKLHRCTITVLLLVTYYNYRIIKYENIWHCCIMPGFITCPLLIPLSVNDKKHLTLLYNDSFHYSSAFKLSSFNEKCILHCRIMLVFITFPLLLVKTFNNKSILPVCIMPVFITCVIFYCWVLTPKTFHFPVEYQFLWII